MPPEENSSRIDASKGDGVVGVAIFGCLVAGVIALFKAFAAKTGVDTLFCTAAAVLAFGGVIWIYAKRF